MIFRSIQLIWNLIFASVLLTLESSTSALQASEAKKPIYALGLTFEPKAVRPGDTTTLTFVFSNNSSTKVRRVRFNNEIWQFLNGAKYTDVPQENFCGEESEFFGTEVDMYDIPVNGKCSLTTVIKIPYDAKPDKYHFTTSSIVIFNNSISEVTAYMRPRRSTLTILPSK